MKDIWFVICLLCIPSIVRPQNDIPSNQTPNNQTLQIGKSFGGGIIFFIDTTGVHGLIVAKTDLQQKMIYGCMDVETFANSPGDGIVNTIIIAKHCGDETAAYQCLHLNIAGYQDWYLPSINELALLFKAMLSPDLFSVGIYWSSSEYMELKNSGISPAGWHTDSESVSWALDFKRGGTRRVLYKDKEAYVRAIRKF
jgi:Protein of unknown function (DUF1566)